MGDSKRSNAWDDVPIFVGGDGPAYRAWFRQLCIAGAGDTDKSGSSLADYFRDMDMGGTNGPPLPPAGNTADRREMERLCRTRSSQAFSRIVQKVGLKPITDYLAENHFGDGRAALAYVDAEFNTPYQQSDYDDLDDRWRAVNIINDIGISSETIGLFSQKLMQMNAERPAAVRHGNDALGAKFLSTLSKTTSLFRQGALDELNAPPGRRTFEIHAQAMFGNQPHP